jgi:hypothetical protein
MNNKIIKKKERKRQVVTVSGWGRDCPGEENIMLKTKLEHITKHNNNS